jgi:competence protein ComGC
VSRRRRPRDEAGFTVIEMSLVSAVLLIVVAMLLPLVSGSLNLFTNTQVRSDAVDNAQLAFNQIDHDVVSSNLLYQDSSGIVHLESYGSAGSSTCVEYQVSYPAPPAAQVATLQRRTKTPGLSTSYPSKWSTVMSGIVNSSQTLSPAVLSVPSSDQYKSLVLDLWVQLDTGTGPTAAAAENYTSTFTGPAIPANAGASATPASEPC